MNPHILIVDDSPSARQALEEMLLTEPYRLSFAKNGPEGIDIARRDLPDVILLDVMMPEVDGFTVCRRLREDPRLAEVPILLVTALDDRESRLQGIRAGADDFISKPFDRAELRARLRTITRLDRYRRLHSEREKFVWAVEQSQEGFLCLDQDDRITYANPRARLYLGLPRDPATPIPGGFLEEVRRQYRCEPASAWKTWNEPRAPIIDHAEFKPGTLLGNAGITPKASPATTPIPSPRQESAVPEVSAIRRYLVRPDTGTAGSFWIQVEMLEQDSADEIHRLVRLIDVTQQILTSRDMWTFHSMVSHKLRTPMTAILGGLELLTEDVGIRPPEAPLIEAMSTAAQRLQDELRELLQYLKIPVLAKAGDGLPAREILELLPRLCGDLDLKAVSVNGSLGIPEKRLKISQRALEWILFEILANARKFHPKGDPIIEVQFTCADARHLRMTLFDNGRHLSPTQILRAWTPFYQGERFFTGETEGLGLGLAMVSSMIWEVGGDCRIANRENHPGIRLELDLPFEEKS